MRLPSPQSLGAVSKLGTLTAGFRTAVKLEALAGGWYIWTTSVGPADWRMTLGRNTAGPRWSTNANGNRAGYVPGYMTIEVEVSGPTAGPTYELLAFPVVGTFGPNPEHHFTALSNTAGSDFSSASFGDVPPDADCVYWRGLTGLATSKVSLRLLGNDGTNDFDIAQMDLGTGLIGQASVTAAQTTHTSLGAIPDTVEELELNARLFVIGGGSGFQANFWGRVAGGSSNVDDILLATIGLTGGGVASGARTLIDLGAKGVYDELLYTVISSSFTGTTVRLSATGRSDPAGNVFGQNRAQRVSITPGAFQTLELTSSGISASESLASEALAYRRGW